MDVQPNLVRCYGTREPPPPALEMAAGDLRCTMVSGSLVGLEYEGVEVLRGLQTPVRDRNWGTCAQSDIREDLQSHSANSDGLSEDRIEYTRQFCVGDGALTGRFSLTLFAAGVLEAEIAFTARTDFTTNRAGFTLLHPLAHVAGTELVVRHKAGPDTLTRFPDQVAPDCPATNICGLGHTIAGIAVAIDFEGEIFEIEDQRNWSDASYKTYCRPLDQPTPYTIGKNTTVCQKVRMTFGGTARSSTTPAALLAPSQNISIASRSENSAPFPQILIAHQSGWPPPSGPFGAKKPFEALAPAGLLARIDLRKDDLANEANAIASLCAGGTVPFDAEIILPHAINPTSGLARVSAAFKARNLKPRHLIALPDSYLGSYQPHGPWPEGPTPAQCANAAKAAFPQAQIGVGMLTNFTELNRARPPKEPGEYLTFSTTAIVHAADDLAVFQTLEALPSLCVTARSFANGRPLRLGLLSIGMRSNPYGARVAANPDLIRQPMAMHDPRQTALYGAAFAVGVASVAASQNLSAIALGAFGGPFGMLTSGPNPGPCPIFHAIRAIAALSVTRMASLDGLPPGVLGLAGYNADNSIQFILANCGLERARITLPGPALTRCLDGRSFDAAGLDYYWLDTSPEIDGAHHTLEPCAVLFGRIGGQR